MAALTSQKTRRTLDDADPRGDALDALDPFRGFEPAGFELPAFAPLPGLHAAAVAFEPTRMVAAAPLFATTSVLAPGAAGTAPSAGASPGLVAAGTWTPPDWINLLTDAGIKADMATAAADGVVTHADLLKIFNDLDTSLTNSHATLSAAQFASLQTIAADLGSGLSTSAYLQNITASLVNGCTANAKWTGGAATATTLGNLAVGSNATQLGELIGKWYLGTDLPLSTVSMSGSTFSVSYQAVNAPLFGTGGPSANDINQGYLGDCYLLASLAELAKQNPSIINSMIEANGNNTWGVRFYVGGQATWVTVNNALPNNGTIFNHSADLWASLVEKAYAQLQASGVFTGNGSYNYGNSWTSIGNGGYPDDVMQEITGASTITRFSRSGSAWSSYTYSPMAPGPAPSGQTGLSTASVLSTLAADLNKGYDVVLSSWTNAYDGAGKQTLVASHAMSVTGIDGANNNLVIRNPWGTASGQYWNTTFEVSLDTLLSLGDTISVDNAARSLALTAQTANLTAGLGKSFSYKLAANTFTDYQGLTFTETATLANGQALPSWLTFDGATGTFSGTPTSGGVTSVTVTATDTAGVSASETFSITVMTPPTVTAQTANATAFVGKAFTDTLAANTFTDPQGAALAYTATLASGQALPSWLTFNAATRTFSGTPAATAAGTTSVKVTATDSYGLASSETFSITVVAPPTVTAQTANQTERATESFTYTLAANTFTDPQGAALTYTATQSSGAALPSWLSFNAATRTFSGTPTAVGTTTVKVTATDAYGLSAAETFAFTVTAPPKLTLQTPTLTEATGRSFSYGLASNTFTDPQGSAMTYRATQSNGQALPSWLSFNATTRTFTGTPATTGTTTVTVTATDALGLAATETFAIAAVAPPTLAVQTANLTKSANQSFTYTLAANTFTDPQGGALAYAATQSSGGALPSWLAFNAATRTFSGTPTTAGTTTVKVTATDSFGIATAETFSITVTAPPKLTAQTPTLTATVGKTFSYALAGTFTDPQNAALTYQATQSNGQALPSWLSFNATTRTFSGTPLATGSTTVTVTATDTLGLSAAETFTITQAAPAAPVVAVQTAGQTWALGQVVNLALPTTTFNGTAMTYTAQQVQLSGDVAAAGWLHFDPTTRAFTGTVAANETGALHLAVTARDIMGATATEYFDVRFKNSQGLLIGTASTLLIGQQQSKTLLQLAAH